MIRVAAAQFAVTNNVQDNLATCLRMIKQAALCSPDLIVLPEFVNHNSWYDNQAHCYEVAVSLDGDFINSIKAAAAESRAYLVLNATVKRPERGELHCTGTSLLISPQGELLAQNNKQVLVGHENDFLDPADTVGPVIDTAIGKLAMYSCMDGVINETPRGLALRGAQILCNSLNSFALDEGDLHIPVRAAENKVFVVAANKVGPLIPEALLVPVSEATSIPLHFLNGAGDSQIVAPDGTVLALAGKGEEVIWADIDPSLADHKTRPDGTDIFKQRRPQLYQALGENPAEQPLPEFTGALDLSVAAISIAAKGTEALAEAVSAVQANPQHKLICLPELFWLAGTHYAEQQVAMSEQVVASLTAACAPDQYVATSIVRQHGDKLAHCAVLISHKGLELIQAQVHFSQRFAWSALTDQFAVYDSIHGKLALVLEDDAIYPESFRLIAMQGCEVVLAPVRQQESWQCKTGLLERASENRVNLVSASTLPQHNLICVLQTEFTIMTPWQQRQFDGLLSAGVQVSGQAGHYVTSATVHPRAAHNKVCSQNTDLIKNRPWKLMQAML
ncbi:nitrilase-related carbon-nitrogen hydrolase [Rheinheimera sp.]|uniref:nitrilase-related carbon-nitrogen hydrolase n=1 Tax=Rheinheimera sp. TaxID=1869214 RepID=UPI00307D093C